ncbi:SPOR domain-containing protein [Lacimicrobium sp. SS2-24]|uniref:SPOR domain-containing protein n=1 Tax=Lacimicrobium sp. SS2-24 TaxID=2005569 RepID=UPI000B4C156E|nr:SPOR domain-containing protein [Lacimicrobium sp. SS2-24]
MTDSVDKTTPRGGSAFQNRLVGTVILVALAVIFLPDILDGEKVSHQDTFVALPERPKTIEIEAPGAFPRKQVEERVTRQVEVVDEVAVDDPVKAGEQDIAEPNNRIQATATDDSGAEQTQPQVEDYPVEDKVAAEQGAWVIQLGSFRHQKNVAELMNKLKDGGYRTFSRQVQTSSGTLTKVFVGPDVQKTALEQRLPALNELTGLQGKVTAYSVE